MARYRKANSYSQAKLETDGTWDRVWPHVIGYQWHDKRSFRGRVTASLPEDLANDQNFGTIPGDVINFREGFFTPRVNRDGHKDLIRNAEGKLVELVSEDQLRPEYNAAYYDNLAAKPAKAPRTPKAEKAAEVAEPVAATAAAAAPAAHVVAPPTPMAAVPVVDAVVYEPDYARQEKLFNRAVANGLKYLVVGCGSEGSAVITKLAKKGITKIVTWDADQVEPPNLPVQWFRTYDPKRAKVEAMRDIVKEFTGADLEIHAEMFTDESPIDADVVIMCVDNMATRQSVFARCENNPAVKLFIDARIGGLEGRVYTINPCDPDQVTLYKSRCVSEDKQVHRPCGMEAIIDTVDCAAIMVSAAVTRYVMKQKVKVEQIFSFQGGGLFTNIAPQDLIES